MANEPVPLRADFDARSVRAAAKRSKDGPQARRLLALPAIYEGKCPSVCATGRIGSSQRDLVLIGGKPAWFDIYRYRTFAVELNPEMNFLPNRKLVKYVWIGRKMMPYHPGNF